MDGINNLISKSPIHITTNTLILIVLSLLALYILFHVISSIIKIVALIAVCWFILMSVQSTNLANIPIVKEAYTQIEKYIPSQELWRQATEYINYEKNQIQNKAE
jgi:hypothetical protein